MPWTRPSNPSPQLQAVLNLLDGLAAKDTEKAGKALSDEGYVSQYAPASLNIPDKEKDDFVRFSIEVIEKLIVNYEIEILDAIETEDRVVLHAQSSPSAVGKFTKTPYTNEYILIFTVSKQDDGSYRIVKTLEFIDSAFSKTWFPAEREAAVKAAKAI